MLAFRNLGLVTPYPRLVLVFYLFRNLTNFDCVPPAYPLGIWKGSCGLITLSAIFISFLFQRLVCLILFSKFILKTHQRFFFISIFFTVKIAVSHFSPHSMFPNSFKIFTHSSLNIHPFKLIIYMR
jgi:hypothetical protein